MKWLYRILRLFFCPHKFELLEKYNRKRVFQATWTEKDVTVESQYYINRCKYCGKLEKFETQ